MSVLAQGFADPALGELVLADDSLGVDPQQHVDAVPGPFGDLGRVDAAVEPRGQTRVPQVVGPPGQGRGLLGWSKGSLASFRNLIERFMTLREDVSGGMGDTRAVG
jgi:hypothetical protein